MERACDPLSAATPSVYSVKRRPTPWVGILIQQRCRQWSNFLHTGRKSEQFIGEEHSDEASISSSPRSHNTNGQVIQHTSDDRLESTRIWAASSGEEARCMPVAFSLSRLGFAPTAEPGELTCPAISSSIEKPPTKLGPSSAAEQAFSTVWRRCGWAYSKPLSRLGCCRFVISMSKNSL